MLGPVGLQVVLDELGEELGETIPETIIEAQRMYLRENPFLRWKGAGKEGVRRWLAIQGLGNLVVLDQLETGFSARIENPALPTILVGSALGFFEYTTNREGRAEWSVSEDGDLQMEVVSK